jgi:hypothetical protein
MSGGTFGALALFTNQTAEWRPVKPGTKDIHGNPAYGEAIPLRCRIVANTETVSDIMGRGVHADCAVMTQRRVKDGDLVTYEGVTYKMQGYSQVPWVSGQFMGRFLLGVRHVVPPQEEG